MALYPMQITIPQFSGYIRSLVNELYEPLQAAIDGNLTGTAGTLGTVFLCETLLSYMPTCNPMNQPYRILAAYDVEPRSAQKRTNRIDLSRYASTMNGFLLYIEQPAIEKVYVPLTSITGAARSTVMQVLDFLKALKGRQSLHAFSGTAVIIVNIFRNDLCELGVVTDVRKFDGDILDGAVVVTVTAKRYVHRVFIYKF